MKIAILTLVAALVAIVVIFNTPDRGQCLASETYVADEPYVVTYIPMGGGVMMPIYGSQRVTHTRCTRWEFPEGRP